MIISGILPNFSVRSGNKRKSALRGSACDALGRGISDTIKLHLAVMWHQQPWLSLVAKLWGCTI
ncbi:MAG TPA: hypothetical protein VE956_09405 [Nodularia sp. (in: cyanobacteria)]|nr:hypothetical protein [Nodularia sp. (in: cyanobacteria)]